MSEDVKKQTFAERMDAYAHEIITNALVQAGGNRKAAAESLGVNRTHVYVLMTRYNVNVPVPEEPEPKPKTERKSKAKNGAAASTKIDW